MTKSRNSWWCLNSCSNLQIMHINVYFRSKEGVKSVKCLVINAELLTTSLVFVYMWLAGAFYTCMQRRQSNKQWYLQTEHVPYWTASISTLTYFLYKGKESMIFASSLEVVSTLLTWESFKISNQMVSLGQNKETSVKIITAIPTLWNELADFWKPIESIIPCCSAFF